MDFKSFDRRHYPTVPPRAGYGMWAATYETAVPDLLDIGVLERFQTVKWDSKGEGLDLACGTGRTGQWLTRRGVSTIDGIDLTPEMLAKAREKTFYRNLYLGSVEETGISDVKYDLIVMSLGDEHLESLDSVYKEAYRLSAVRADFVVVGMHPFFFMTGMPTHFKDSGGNPVAIRTHIHLISDHVRAALAAGWKLREMHEGVIDEEWIQIKPKWDSYKGYPVNFGYVWERA
ncbi:MAG: class I SAM-dependent methyltransferase [Bdellovibrionales bacterium]